MTKHLTFIKPSPCIRHLLSFFLWAHPSQTKSDYMLLGGLEWILRLNSQKVSPGNARNAKATPLAMEQDRCGCYFYSSWEDCCPMCHPFQGPCPQHVSAGWNVWCLHPALTGHNRCGISSWVTSHTVKAGGESKETEASSERLIWTTSLECVPSGHWCIDLVICLSISTGPWARHYRYKVCLVKYLTLWRHSLVVCGRLLLKVMKL